MKAYFAWASADIAAVEAILTKPAQVIAPSKRWQQRFDVIRRHLAQLRDESVEVKADDDFRQQQQEMAASGFEAEIIEDGLQMRLCWCPAIALGDVPHRY